MKTPMLLHIILKQQIPAPSAAFETAALIRIKHTDKYPK
jgi:hypothetical protein